MCEKLKDCYAKLTQSKHIKSDSKLYEFARLFLEQPSTQLCLMTIASWYHSFPSRTGQ